MRPGELTFDEKSEVHPVAGGVQRLVLYERFAHAAASLVQGYLAHKKPPAPLGPRSGPRHGLTSRSEGGAISYERGSPVDRETVPNLLQRDQFILLGVIRVETSAHREISGMLVCGGVRRRC